MITVAQRIRKEGKVVNGIIVLRFLYFTVLSRLRADYNKLRVYTVKKIKQGIP